jgi:hypothetical protein
MGCTPSAGSTSDVTRSTGTSSGSPMPVTLAAPLFQTPKLSNVRFSLR